MLTDPPSATNTHLPRPGFVLPCAWASMRRLGGSFARTRRSAVSLELAIVALPFFTMMLGTMEVGYDVYVQSALNAAVVLTARGIADGTIQYADTSSGGTNFVKLYMCPNVSGMLECSKIQVSIANIQETVTSANYWSIVVPAYVTGTGPSATLATGSWGVCTGSIGTPMLFQAIYAGPTFVGGLVPSFIVTLGSAYVHPTYTSTAFVNGIGYTSNVQC